MITVMYTKEQLEAQIQLNHLATQARGMEVAEVAVALCKLLMDARRMSETVQPNGAERPSKPRRGEQSPTVD